MKTLCVAVLLFSLLSVCQPASLACQKLVKPVETGPDLSGRWYYIALSSELCLVPALVNALLWPSFAADIISKDTSNLYSDNTYIKLYGICFNETETFLYVNNSLSDVDSNNAPTNTPDVLLQTGCPDCLVIKTADNDFVDTLVLLSRRTAVTAAELKEFETQSECLGWSKPHLFNPDHDYENCESLYEDMDEDKFSQVFQSFFQKMFERVKTTQHSLTKCMAEVFLSYLPTFF